VGGLWKETAREQRNWAPGEGKGRALDLSRWAGSQIWPSHALSSPTRSWIGPVVVRAKSKSRTDFFFPQPLGFLAGVLSAKSSSGSLIILVTNHSKFQS
jgi:hypothetical protein